MRNSSFDDPDYILDMNNTKSEEGSCDASHDEGDFFADEIFQNQDKSEDHSLLDEDNEKLNNSTNEFGQDPQCENEISNNEFPDTADDNVKACVQGSFQTILNEDVGFLVPEDEQKNESETLTNNIEEKSEELSLNEEDVTKKVENVPRDDMGKVITLSRLYDMMFQGNKKVILRKSAPFKNRLPVYVPKQFHYDRELPARLMQDTILSDLPSIEVSPELDTKCKELINMYKSEGKLPEKEDRLTVLQYLQRSIANAVSKGRYFDANVSQDIMKKLIEADSSQNSCEGSMHKINRLEDKLRDVVKEIKRVECERDDKIRNERAKIAENRQKLESSHQDQMTVFENRWNDASFLKKFERPSPLLLHLSQIERRLVVSKEYVKAEAVRRRVDELSKSESVLAQERAVAEMDRSRTKLIEKQKNEMSIYDQHAETQIAMLEAEFDTELSKLRLRKDRIEAQIESAKKSKGKPVLPPLRSKVHPERFMSESTLTPRTANRMILCKSAFRNPKISVKPLGPVTRMSQGTKSRNSSSFEL